MKRCDCRKSKGCGTQCTVLLFIFIEPAVQSPVSRYYLCRFGNRIQAGGIKQINKFYIAVIYVSADGVAAYFWKTTSDMISGFISLKSPRLLKRKPRRQRGGLLPSIVTVAGCCEKLWPARETQVAPVSWCGEAFGGAALQQAEAPYSMRHLTTTNESQTCLSSISGKQRQV